MAAILFALSWAKPAAANVFGPDNRKDDPPFYQNHAAAIVGSIVTNGFVPVSQHPTKLARTGATAFMVSPCHALTNFHAVFGKAASHGDTGHTVTLTIRGAKTYNVIGTPVTWGSLAARQDWALLKLSKCVGLDYLIGWGVPVVTEIEHYITDVRMTGFPGDKNRNVSWTSQCQVDGIETDNILVDYDCASLDGSSGSPVYAVTGLGIPQVLALNAGSQSQKYGHLAHYTYEDRNIGILYSTILPLIKSRIEDAISHFNMVNPQITLSDKYH